MSGTDVMALRIRHLCCASAGSAFVQLHKLNEKMAAWIHARTMSEETAHNTKVWHQRLFQKRFDRTHPDEMHAEMWYSITSNVKGPP